MNRLSTVQYASMSDIGFRRRNNQDAFAIKMCSDQAEWESFGHMFLVADGMGGHAVGELASKIAADSLPHIYFKDQNPDRSQALKQSIEATNHAINERGTLNQEFARMGTTCSALLIGPFGALIGHVGDSRVYRVRARAIEQLTFDHSLQWELMRLGRMSPEEIMLSQPRNIITRSLGPESHVEVDLEGPYPVAAGDTFVICSDGLTSHVSDEEIGTITGELPPVRACRLLVNLANLRGGSDNITVVVVQVQGNGQNNPPADLEPEPSRFEASWMTLLGTWSLAVILVLGILLLLADHPERGIPLIVSSVFLMVVLGTWRWQMFRERRQSQPRSKSSAPYRHASAKLTRRFISDLAALQAELERSAVDEGWEVNWTEHQQLHQTAQNSISSRNLVPAFDAYAQMLDLMMNAIQLQRRQLSNDSKNATE